MRFAGVEKIANAVLYEGYILYPYRASSTKNQQRWNFGTLYPQSFAEAQKPPEAFAFTAECLVEGGRESTVDLRVRFLQLPSSSNNVEAGEWAQGLERSAEENGISLMDVLRKPASFPLQFAGPHSLTGNLTLAVQPMAGPLLKISIQLSNVTPADVTTRDAALGFSFVSAHLLLGVEGGVFVSLLDPPQQYRQAAAECHNVGVFPVLAGDEANHDTMLCSPIILYDYPQVAPESQGDFFDGTEMDEMLSLRVLTMTEEEKAEIRNGDPRARSILERTETLPDEHLMKLHGAIRGLRRVRQTEGE